MESNEKEILQAFTDGLCALAIALSRQLDGPKLIRDLRSVAEFANEAGNVQASALTNEIAMTLEAHGIAKDPGSIERRLALHMDDTARALRVITATIAGTTRTDAAIGSALDELDRMRLPNENFAPTPGPLKPALFALQARAGAQLSPETLHRLDTRLRDDP